MSASAGPHCPRDGAPTVDGPAPEFAPGSKVFGRFEIGEAVARGGTGTIYRARDEAGGQIALKVVHADLTKSPVDRSRIKRDIAKATTVTHPGIVRVREVGETEGRIFLVREFVEGDALASLLLKDGPFELSRAARIVHTLAEALVEAHRAGVLHRDLNARHVIVQLDGSPALLDFALSAPIPGGVAGKPAFGSIEALAPEQAAGKLVTLRADLYGLGLLLRQTLTGEPIKLPEDPTTALAVRAEAEAPPAPPGVPPAIGSLLSQLLARDPKDRPFGARAVEKALAELSRAAAPRATTAPIKPVVKYAAPAPASVVPPSPARKSPPPRGATLPMRAAVPEPEDAPVAPPPPEAAATQPYPTLPDGAPDIPDTPSLEAQLDEALQVVARSKERPDATASLGSDAPSRTPLPATRTPLPPTRTPLPPTRSPSLTPRPAPPIPKSRPPEPPPAGRPGPLPRTAKKTLIGIPLPDAADPSTAVRQKWARNVLGLKEGEGESPARVAVSGLPDTLQPPRRAATAQGVAPTATPLPPSKTPSPPPGKESAATPLPPSRTPTPAPARTPLPPSRTPSPPPGKPAPVPVARRGATATPAPPQPDAEPTPPPIDIATRETPIPPPPVRAATEPMGAPAVALEELVKKTEAERVRLEELEAAASALSQPPPEPYYPPVPSMPKPQDVVLAPRAPLGGPDESSITDAARAFRPKGGARKWIYVGAGALALVVVVGVAMAVSGPNQPPRPTAPPRPITPPPAVAPPVPVPPVAAPPVLVDGGPLAAVDAAAASTADAAALPAMDGGALVATAADGGLPAVPDAGAAPAPIPPPPPAPAVHDDDPRSTVDIIKAARSNVRRRRWSDARRGFELALAREPTNVDALLGAALVAVSERRHEDALRHFQTAVQARPDSATLHVYLGNAYLMNDDRASAEREWRRALELDPTHREARLRLGLGVRAPRPQTFPHAPPAGSHAPPTKAPPTKAPPPARRPGVVRSNPYR